MTDAIRNLTSEQKKKIHAIIHSASASTAAVGGSTAQLPVPDTAIITPIQVAMIISIGNVFGLTISESAAKSWLAEALAATAGRTISKLLLGWIPVAGNIINASTAAGLTEALGWAVAQEYAAQS